jgi:hypothetical protein
VKWLKTNWTTMAMAVTLSLLTVGMLTTPGEDDPPVTLTARFLPEVRAQVGSLEYWVDGKRYTDRIPVLVSGDKAQILVIDLVCKPILDEAKFPADPAVRETTVEITAKDFDLTDDMARRIRILPVNVKITFAPMMTKMLTVEVSPADIQDSQGARFRVDAVRAIPPEIKVRLPVDKAATLKSLPIRPIRISGRTTSFTTEGRLNTDIPDLKDARALEPFLVAVDLSPVQYQKEMPGVPLFLSCPPIPGQRAELIDRLTFKVILDGPQDLVEKMKPEQVHVYVKLDWTPDTAAGNYQLPIKCELADESLRKLVQVKVAPGEPIMASVQVNRG